jgi:excisionase family DNA binding protein
MKMLEQRGKSLAEKGWLSPEEAVRYSGIGRTRLYRYLTSGALRSAKLGRTRHIRKEDLDAFLEERMSVAK